MSRSRKPWWGSCQWEVITPVETPDNSSATYKAIYCSRSKKGAQKDAREWTARGDGPAFVVPGAGHRSRRDLPKSGHAIMRNVTR